jgi:hypothetical protein
MMKMVKSCEFVNCDENDEVLVLVILYSCYTVDLMKMMKNLVKMMKCFTV